MDKAKRNGVSTNVELAPFLRYGLGKTDDGGFGRGVVRLANIAVQTRR